MGGAAGCSGGGTDATSRTVVGTYALASVNSSPLPFTFPIPGGTTTIVSGSLTLTQYGTWQSTIPLRFTRADGQPNGEFISQDDGTYQVRGDSIYLYIGAPFPKTYPGTVNGRSLTINSGGVRVWTR